MTPAELATSARHFLYSGPSLGPQAMPHASTGLTCWPRAVAFRGRQALEQALDDLWAALAPSVGSVSRRAQLLCLHAFVRDQVLVSDVREAWHGLSRACHHQLYELSPTAAELEHWLDAVDRLLRHDPLESDRRRRGL